MEELVAMEFLNMAEVEEEVEGMEVTVVLVDKTQLFAAGGVILTLVPLDLPALVQV
jgi:hypothetical protein